MNIGDQIPNLSFHATQGLSGHLHDFSGRWLILYFYPKDATPGCTIEGQCFRDSNAAFSAADAVILGVSRDSLASHERFKAKEHFSFELISDEDEVLCQAFDVIQTKSMYGKQVRGIDRSTFLIDPQGIIRQIWRGVKVDQHVSTVLAVLKSMQDTATHP